MINPEFFINTLHENGIDFFTGVPDSFLNTFCAYLRDNCHDNKNIIAANEGNAIAIASGYNFATGKTPLVYMQNSGIGNAVNPLVSLSDKNVYSVPMILLIGWRGGPNSKDKEQHKTQGEITPALMDVMNIPYVILNDDETEVAANISLMSATARNNSSPVAFIAPKGIFSGGKSPIDDKSFPLSREEAMNVVLSHLSQDTIYAATTGRAARELHALRDERSESHENDFLNVGSMGHASSVALGIAISKPEKKVVCFDGDGALIMHMGSLTTIGKIAPNNFIHIVLNNGMHESVGAQPSAGRTADFTAIAKASGYETADFEINDEETIKRALDLLKSADKPVFLDIQIHAGLRDNLPVLNVDHNEIITLLRNNLQGEN